MSKPEVRIRNSVVDKAMVEVEIRHPHEPGTWYLLRREDVPHLFAELGEWLKREGKAD